MKVFGTTLSSRVSAFFDKELRVIESIAETNLKLFNLFGIVDFFHDEAELKILKQSILVQEDDKEDCDRTAYGDFQTNAALANKVILHLLTKNAIPEVIIEPTCGKGSFIIAALENIKTIKHIFGIEIYKPYIWETKFNIVDFFLTNPTVLKPSISIIHANVFDFNFKKIAQLYALNSICIVGNPPWVTNSKLGSLNSTNLPKKSNFKNHTGLDAMTGKGNFDIGEYITLALIETFQHTNTHLSLLVKNTVVKNCVSDQKKNQYRIASIEKYGIDSKKEFNVSVEASILYCKLNSTPAFNCTEFDFYDYQKSKLRFGWVVDRFVSNIDSYRHAKHIDGQCPFVWRQGLKHDCAAVMELNKQRDCYVNGLQEEVSLEDGLVFGLLKSSDLKNTVIAQTRKYTIVTQQKVGQDTQYIKREFPQTYAYLVNHLPNFEARKSSIYTNKPLFSIFGIGDYSFKPYKVAISGLYKTFHFTLVLPQNGKAVMLDDTCYLLGFDEIEFAIYTLILLNSEKTKLFLDSITFADAKRTFTKELLMRIDLLVLALAATEEELAAEIDRLNRMYKLTLNLNRWNEFLALMYPVNKQQMKLFA